MSNEKKPRLTEEERREIAEVEMEMIAPGYINRGKSKRVPCCLDPREPAWADDRLSE